MKLNLLLSLDIPDDEAHRLELDRSKDEVIKTFESELRNSAALAHMDWAYDCDQLPRGAGAEALAKIHRKWAEVLWKIQISKVDPL